MLAHRAVRGQLFRYLVSTIKGSIRSHSEVDFCNILIRLGNRRSKGRSGVHPRRQSLRRGIGLASEKSLFLYLSLATCVKQPDRLFCSQDARQLAELLQAEGLATPAAIDVTARQGFFDLGRGKGCGQGAP